MQIKPQPARASKQSVALNYTLQSMFDKSSMATACFGFKDRTGGYEESSGTSRSAASASSRATAASLCATWRTRATALRGSPPQDQNRMSSLVGPSAREQSDLLTAF